MSRSSEDVLLQVSQVKYKKYEGILFVMSERIGWMPGSKSTFSVAHKYTEIKSQKISPEGKSKIQLQIVLHDGNSTTFHFVNAGGQATQMMDRDKVKEKLVELLPKFKRKINKELEEKNKTLSDNPGLLQLYKDLVITQIITAEEFWANHAAEYVKQKQGVKQEVGVAGYFLAEIKPQADGANGLKYNLTPDIIESIFKTYPAVKRKHSDNVPNKLSEQEFWTKFFQSHYFHRDRVHAQGTKDLFTECARDDDKCMKKQLEGGVSEQLADIQNFNDSTLATGFGGAVELDTVNNQNIVHQNIIKRFNQHSIMVMETASQPVQSTEEGGDAAQSPPAPANPRKRILEKSNFDDLGAPDNKKPAALSLSRLERYFTGPTPAASQDYLTQDELHKSRINLQQELKVWTAQRNPAVLSSAAAVSVLGDLSPGGAMMVGSRQDLLAEQCPLSVQSDLRHLYSSVCELIRHFWDAFPPTNPELAEKAKKMYETLQKFQAMKVRPFETEVERRYSAGGGHITQHINKMLESAYKKYTTWVNKKR